MAGRCQRRKGVSFGGFTLMELVITIVVIAILVSVAIPSYEFALVRSRAVSAQACLMKHAQFMEQYRTHHMTYADAVLPECDDVGADHYSIEFVAPPTASRFTLRAMPLGRQAQLESRCGTMTVDNSGRRTQSTPDCW